MIFVFLKLLLLLLLYCYSFFFQLKVLTFLPSLILCWSTFARMSFSRRFPALKNRRENFNPNLILSPHPPHNHASRFCKFFDSSHVHLSMVPLLHARANVCTRLAELIAYRNEVSLKPENNAMFIIIKLRIWYFEETPTHFYIYQS
jgi:hypothetical protein